MEGEERCGTNGGWIMTQYNLGARQYTAGCTMHTLASLREIITPNIVRPSLHYVHNTQRRFRIVFKGVYRTDGLNYSILRCFFTALLYNNNY